MKPLVLAALTLGVCGLSAGLQAPVVQAQSSKSVQIISVVMALDYKNGKAVSVVKNFKPTNLKFHCVAELNRTASVTARGVWYAVDAGGMRNFKIVEASLPKQLADQLHFNASLPRPWPTGKYRIDIYINNKKARSVPFSVVK